MTAANESFKGTGKLHIDGRHVGNATIVANANTNENIDLQNFQAPGGGLYNRVSRTTERNLTVEIADYSKENLEIALFGTSSENTGASVSDESITARSIVDRLILTANMMDVTQTIQVDTDPATTPLIEGTDYTVSAAGITPIAGGAISADEALLVTYTSLDSFRVEAGTAGQVEHEVVLDGLDEAQSGAPPFVFRAFKVRFPTAEEISLITEGFGSLTLPGVMLPDTTKIAPESQYYYLEKVKPA